MARVRISLDTGPLGEVIGKIKARTSNLLPLMKEFHALAIGAVDDKFRREGPGWPEHAESTKARRGANAAILRDKARLSQSMAGGNADAIVKIGKNYVEVGSTVPYARIHNFGGTIQMKPRKAAKPSKKSRQGEGYTIVIPQRRFLPNESELEPDLLDAAEDYLQEVIDAG